MLNGADRRPLELKLGCNEAFGFQNCNPCPQTSLLPISPTAHFDPIYTLAELTQQIQQMSHSLLLGPLEKIFGVNGLPRLRNTDRAEVGLDELFGVVVNPLGHSADELDHFPR